MFLVSVIILSACLYTYSSEMVVFLVMWCVCLLLLTKKFHFLKTLLFLEALGLSLMSFFSWDGGSFMIYSFFLFVLFTFLVCEASLGLGVLINHSRSQGSDSLII